MQAHREFSADRQTDRQTWIVNDWWRWGCNHSSITLILALQTWQIRRWWHAPCHLADTLQCMPVCTSCTHTHIHTHTHTSIHSFKTCGNWVKLPVHTCWQMSLPTFVADTTKWWQHLSATNKQWQTFVTDISPNCRPTFFDSHPITASVIIISVY